MMKHVANITEGFAFFVEDALKQNKFRLRFVLFKLLIQLIQS